MKITNSQKYVRNSFQMCEFWKGADFDLPDCLLDGCQVIREYFGRAMKVTSTFRPADTFGYHKEGRAVDLVTADPVQSQRVINLWNQELLNYVAGKGSALVTALRRAGVTGMGVEKTCIHIDARPPATGTRSDEFGRFTIFEFDYYISAAGKMVITKNRAL